jgi:hypothetical protein
MHTVAILAHVAASWHAGNKSGMCPGVLFPDISYAHKVAEAATLALTCIFWKNGGLGLCIGSGSHPAVQLR